MQMKEIVLAESIENGKILIEAIKIVEALSKNEIADTDLDDYGAADESVNEIKRLIIKARTLTNNSRWENIV